jgi:cell division septal protein FtsQ
MKSRRIPRRQPLNPATILLVQQFAIGLFVFACIGIILTVVWYGTRLPAFTISAVEASGGITIDRETVTAATESVLEGAYLKLIPRRFVYFYPEEALLERLRQIERIKDVHVVREGTVLHVTYGEYTPEALWCKEESQETCLFIDETGHAFDSAPDLIGGTLLRYYSLQREPTLGDRPMTEADYSATKEFVARLAETGWYIESVEVDTVRDVFYGLNSGGELKVSLSEDPKRAIDFLNTIRQSDEFKHLAPGNFNYVDLRFGTKIFVNEEFPELATSTATSTTSLPTEIE